MTGGLDVRQDGVKGHILIFQKIIIFFNSNTRKFKHFKRFLLCLLCFLIYFTYVLAVSFTDDGRGSC